MIKKTKKNTPHKLDMYWHITRNTLISILLIAAALGIGMFGYHKLNKLNWIDSLVNASMILSGMGPVSPLINDAAKIFASFYALFSGLAFIAIVVVMLSPVFRRFFHKLHLEFNE